MTSNGEILPGVHRIDAVLGERLSSLYLFVGEQRAVLFDTGVDGTIPQTVIPYLERVGLSVCAIDTVVISHCDVDHHGGIQDVHDYLPGAQVMAHGLDADAMEDFDSYERDRGRSFRSAYGFDEGPDEWARSVVRVGTVDRRITTDALIDLGDRTVQVLHVPGHTRGHLSIYDPANSFIAISDAILGDAVPFLDGKPAFPPTYRYEADYLNSIARVEKLGVTLIGTAHYGCFSGSAVEQFLSLSRRFAAGLKLRVLDEVRQAKQGTSLEELAVALNSSIGSWPKGDSIPALVFPIAAHLEQLEEDGAIRQLVRTESPVTIFIDTV